MGGAALTGDDSIPAAARWAPSSGGGAACFRASFTQAQVAQLRSPPPLQSVRLRQLREIVSKLQIYLWKLTSNAHQSLSDTVTFGDYCVLDMLI